MTAVSSYAPPRRNSLLQRQESSSSQLGGKTTARVGLLLLVIRFWKDAAPLLKNLFREVTEPLVRKILEWIQLGKERLRMLTAAESTATTSTCREINETRAMNGHSHHNNKQQSSDDKSERIRENQELIQKVLKYWFGQYAPDESQKKLWMIAAQSVAHREKVDHEIAEQFGDLLMELLVLGDRWGEWCSDLYGYQGKIAAIIVLDQFSRHIHRSNHPIVALGQLHAQSVMDERALETAQRLVKQHADELQAGMIPTPMYIFAMMPFRHASQTETVEFVQTQIERMDDLQKQGDTMVRRFRKATNRRMAVLQDEARRTGDGSSKTEYTHGDILECAAFQADMSTAVGHPVLQTIRTFLTDRHIHPASSLALASNQVPPTPIIVSLSGGVDSMVIASVLAHLNRSRNYNLRIIATHIDYANRPESGAEAAFCEQYCQEQGIDFRCRRIDEVTRGVTARDEYEKISRQVRYDFYRQTIEECQGDESIEVGVMLGHHRGDLRENVLSNAHKGCGPLDLSGMTAVSQNDGVPLFRPLLPLEKTFIYDYAHKFGVPYFKDTTPHWSTRGKLRNKLLPLLEEIYGEGSMNNLSNLAVESDECRDLFYDVSLGPFLDKVRHLPMGICFQTVPWKDQGNFFWKFVLREALHSAGLGMFTDKSVASFLGRVQAPKLREGWLQCRKDYAVYLQQDGRILILYPASFPFRKADMYQLDGRSVEYGRDKSVQIGPWRVTAHLLRQLRSFLSKTEVQERLEIKAIKSMDDFMEGSLEYYVQVPTWQTEDGSFEPRPLIFASFKKETRPKAWKNIDLRIQDTLPLLGNDETALKALKDPQGSGAVHTDEYGEEQENPFFLVKVTLRLASIHPAASP